MEHTLFNIFSVASYFLLSIIFKVFPPDPIFPLCRLTLNHQSQKSPHDWVNVLNTPLYVGPKRQYHINIPSRSNFYYPISQFIHSLLSLDNNIHSQFNALL